MAQHDDKPSELRSSSYRRFLVDSPLVHVPPPAATTAGARKAAAGAAEDQEESKQKLKEEAEEEDDSDDMSDSDDDTNSSISDVEESLADDVAGSNLGVSSAGGVQACGYGSFHQQYWLDGRLVAVGVVDILPR